MPPHTTIVLPSFNEEEALPVVVADIRSVLGTDADILVVDDGSSDGTANVARDLGCAVEVHATNRGKGAAIRTGVAAASGEIVIVMDADATYPAATIPAMVDLLEDNDFVRAERNIDASNTPAINRLGNVLLGKAMTSLHGLDAGDYLSGLYGARREVFERLGTEADGFDIEVEIGIKSQANELKVATLPTDYTVDIEGGEDRCDLDPSYPGSYAASHPEEDFAESFAHVLHLLDTVLLAPGLEKNASALLAQPAPFGKRDPERPVAPARRPNA